MTAWLAADTTPSGAATWKDLLALGAPVATIAAALIGGYILVRNARQSPYDRLDVLVKARSLWPAELHGRGALDRAIRRAMAMIRAVEGDVTAPFETEEERTAAQDTADRLGRLLVIVAGCVAVVAGAAYVLAGWLRDEPIDDVQIAAAVIFGACVGFLVLIFGISQLDGKLFPSMPPITPVGEGAARSDSVAHAESTADLIFDY